MHILVSWEKVFEAFELDSWWFAMEEIRVTWVVVRSWIDDECVCGPARTTRLEDNYDDNVKMAMTMRTIMVACWWARLGERVNVCVCRIMKLMCDLNNDLQLTYEVYYNTLSLFTKILQAHFSLDLSIFSSNDSESSYTTYVLNGYKRLANYHHHGNNIGILL